MKRADVDVGQGPPGALTTVEREELGGNTARRHSHLGYVSPIEFELRSQTAAPAA